MWVLDHFQFLVDKPVLWRSRVCLSALAVSSTRRIRVLPLLAFPDVQGLQQGGVQASDPWGTCGEAGWEIIESS